METICILVELRFASVVIVLFCASLHLIVSMSDNIHLSQHDVCIMLCS